MGKEDYRTAEYLANKRRVCEIYGVDPKRASVHHILPRAEGGTNEKSNLYPFPANGKGKSAEHQRLHELMRAIEAGKVADVKDGREKLRILFQSKK